jgi:hypothetical protein
VTASITDTRHNNALPSSECRVLFIVMLNVIMLGVVMMNVVMLSVVVPCLVFLGTYTHGDTPNSAPLV